MSDLKLYRLSNAGVVELKGAAAQVEKSLQTLFERNLDAFLGVKFLASEHSTGPVHGGRIDTLGIDEDGSPVIIEYKRAITENVINQGLFYLDWLMDHRGDFEILVQRKLGADSNKGIDWRNPRLLCIAGDFTRYDEHAVNQIGRNIELLRYRKFGDDLLVIELVHAARQGRVPKIESDDKQTTPEARSGDQYISQRISYRVAQTKGPLRDLFDSVFQFLSALGDDVQVKELQNYIAFRRIKNFACLEVYPHEKVVRVHVYIDLESIVLEDGFTRDVTNIGHFGTGNLQINIRTIDDFKRAQSLFLQSYEGA